MRHDEKVRLRTGVEISRLSLGTAAIGGLYTSVSDEDCTETILTAVDNGINFIDTAPHYGKGTSERRIGRALAGRDRSTFVISTKIGRLLVPSTTDIDDFFMDADNTVERKFDFSASGVRQSLESSLERLGMDSVEVLFIHDPDENADAAIIEAYPELDRMRSEGIIKAIGVGMNQCETPTRVIKETDIDMVLIAGRYSLLDQRALIELLPTALERNVDIIAAGVFNSGILANPVKGATYDYVPASDELLAKALRIREVLDGHQVSLTSAALQFPLRHPAVKSVLVGCRSAGEVKTNIDAFNLPIENKVWDDLVSVL
ncbi:oxidoreductase [freshwater metagenome]|uniref:Oxidoreductase n=1 Tax=freshwater metagenome TaxID=449393 RepID=A0A094QBV2_9ZZZZ